MCCNHEFCFGRLKLKFKIYISTQIKIIHQTKTQKKNNAVAVETNQMKLKRVRYSSCREPPLRSESLCELMLFLIDFQWFV
ncbi:hypothetical protein AtEden1_Chr5g0125481 [Arabidopsis thaliana]